MTTTSRCRLVIGISLAFILVALSVTLLSRYNRRHDVLYMVDGKSNAEFVYISYANKPIYDFIEGKTAEIKQVRVRANELPWMTKVQLPSKAIAYIVAGDGSTTKTRLRLRIALDGEVWRTQTRPNDLDKALFAVGKIGVDK